MTTFIMIYHNGVIIINEIGSYEFVGINEIFLFDVVRLMRERLGWMDEGYEVRFEGQNYIGSSNDTRIKMMSPVCDKNECTPYVGVVMESKIHGIELVVRMVTQNDVADERSRSSTLPNS
jgi:hypothetical protein